MAKEEPLSDWLHMNISRNASLTAVEYVADVVQIRDLLSARTFRFKVLAVRGIVIVSEFKSTYCTVDTEISEVFKFSI